jgi:hypothetical protein
VYAAAVADEVGEAVRRLGERVQVWALCRGVPVASRWANYRRRAAAMFALAWGLAARSPHTIVYLPLRRAELPDHHAEGRPLDLVLLHHRLAFPPSRWKQVRAGLGTGWPHSVVLPSDAWRSRPVADHRRSWHQEFRDHLRWDIPADTLVLTGSRKAFDLEADQSASWPRGARLIAPGRRRRTAAPRSAWAEPRRYPDRRRPYAELHAQYSR